MARPHPPSLRSRTAVISGPRWVSPSAASLGRNRLRGPLRGILAEIGHSRLESRPLPKPEFCGLHRGTCAGCRASPRGQGFSDQTKRADHERRDRANTGFSGPARGGIWRDARRGLHVEAGGSRCRDGDRYSGRYVRPLLPQRRPLYSRPAVGLRGRGPQLLRLIARPRWRWGCGRDHSRHRSRRGCWPGRCRRLCRAAPQLPHNHRPAERRQRDPHRALRQ